LASPRIGVPEVPAAARNGNNTKQPQKTFYIAREAVDWDFFQLLPTGAKRGHRGLPDVGLHASQNEPIGHRLCIRLVLARRNVLVTGVAAVVRAPRTGSLAWDESTVTFNR